MQNMISSPKRSTAFDGDNVLRLFNDANQPIISAHIGTQWTGVFLGKMETTRTKPGFFFQLFDGFRQSHGIFAVLP
jgi:hypothetical protein